MYRRPWRSKEEELLSKETSEPVRHDRLQGAGVMERGTPGSKESVIPEFNGFYPKAVNNTSDEVRYNVSYSISFCSIHRCHYEQCSGFKSQRAIFKFICLTG